MRNTTIERPKQALPSSKKTKKWAKENVEAFIKMSDFNGFNSRKSDISKLYDYYNGEIDDSDYNYVLRPYSKKRRNFPAEIRNYPIIAPVVNYLLGERERRPDSYTVKVSNDDAGDIKAQQKMKFIKQEMLKRFVNNLNQMGVETGIENQEETPFEDIDAQFEESYSDYRAIVGQNALNFIQDHQDILEKFSDLWKDFVITGEVYSYKDVINDEVIYERISPLFIDYAKDSSVKYIEDADWVVIRLFKHPSNVIDEYYSNLSTKEVRQIEDPNNDGNLNNEDASFYQMAELEASEEIASEKANLVEVVKVFWKSRKKIGFVTYLDNFGRLQEKQVEEGYETKEGENVEWSWVNEVWEGHRINGDIYKKLAPREIQRNALDNASTCKLPINGIRKKQSIVSTGIPYQLIYNIYRYRLETAIAKSKEIVAQFDISMIPDSMDMDKFLYYLDALGIAWVDSSKESSKFSASHKSVMDMSIKVIDQYIALFESIRAEYERVIGINRQRQGIIGEYEGKGASQQAIIQSSYVTEILHRTMDRFITKDRQGLLDISKYAFINGKKGAFVLPNGNVEFLKLDGETHMNSEYGIFASNNSRDMENLRQIKQLTQPMLQNGSPLSMIPKILKSNSFQEIETEITKSEKMREKLEQAQMKAQQEAQQQEAQLRQEELDQRERESIRKSETELEKEAMKINADRESDQQDISLDERKLNVETEVKKQELAETKRHNKKQEEIDKMKAKNSNKKNN